MGDGYELVFDFDEVPALERAITHLYEKWNSKQDLELNRKDLEHYMSPEYLKKELS